MLSIKNRIEMETTVKLYSLNYSNVKTYLFALLFVAGNICITSIVSFGACRWSYPIAYLLFHTDCIV